MKQIIVCYNVAIEQNVIDANKYLKLEPILCHICSNNDDSLSLGSIQMNEDLVKHTQYLRSADIRILHHVLSILTNGKMNDGLLKFLKYENVLIDIEEDIVGYHEDVVNNTMNS